MRKKSDWCLPIRRLTVCFCLILVPVAVAQTPDTKEHWQLADLAWMTGDWQKKDGDSLSQEMWTTPAGGVMLGLNRIVKPQKRAFFEYLRIETRSEGLYYVASPGGKAPTAFKCSQLGRDFVVFENKTHDFPQVIRYWLKSTGELCAEISAEVNGKKRAMQWCWQPNPDSLSN